MATGDSMVSIMNGALFYLGEDPIASPGDATKRAIILSQRYDPVRRAMLRGFPWPCAKQAINLPLSTYAPPVTYDYAYALPADCLRFLDLPDNDMALWEVGQDATAGQLLLTNETPPLAGTYIRDLTDPTRFDSLFVAVFELKLAEDTCEALTQSTQKLTNIRQALGQKELVAQLTSSDEQSSRELDEDIWLRSRR